MKTKVDYDGLFEGRFKKFIGGTSLKLHLNRRGWITHKCAECGIDELWNDKRLVLQLDHIDGDNTNNRRSNLRELCPNCHSQTSTFGGKNSSHAKRGAKPRLPKYGDRKTYLESVRLECIERNKDTIALLIEADIDYSKFGWVDKASKVIGVSPQKVRPWINRCCPQLLDKAYKRQMGVGAMAA